MDLTPYLATLGLQGLKKVLGKQDLSPVDEDNLIKRHQAILRLAKFLKNLPKPSKAQKKQYALVVKLRDNLIRDTQATLFPDEYISLTSDLTLPDKHILRPLIS